MREKNKNGWGIFRNDENTVDERRENASDDMERILRDVCYDKQCSVRNDCDLMSNLFCIFIKHRDRPGRSHSYKIEGFLEPGTKNQIKKSYRYTCMTTRSWVLILTHIRSCTFSIPHFITKRGKFDLFYCAW
jgi:hypothetical protein